MAIELVSAPVVVRRLRVDDSLVREADLPLHARRALDLGKEEAWLLSWARKRGQTRSSAVAQLGFAIGPESCGTWISDTHTCNACLPNNKYVGLYGHNNVRVDVTGIHYTVA